MMSKKDGKDGRSNNQPPIETRFKKGQSGNPKGRPKKRPSTFESEVKSAFGEERQIKINGTVKTISMRQLILEQIARGAAQGDHKMIKLSIPFMKTMDDAPEFEVLPEDKKALAAFLENFNEDGSTKNESE